MVLQYGSAMRDALLPASIANHFAQDRARARSGARGRNNPQRAAHYRHRHSSIRKHGHEYAAVDDSTPAHAGTAIRAGATHRDRSGFKAQRDETAAEQILEQCRRTEGAKARTGSLARTRSIRAFQPSFT